MEEKGLVSKEKWNIFQKIHAFFKKLFDRQPEKEVVMNRQNDDNHSVISEFEKENMLIQRQKEYEDGVIKEEELTENEKQDLLSLYQKQIETLEMDVIHYQARLKSYKMEIMEKQELLNKK